MITHIAPRPRRLTVVAADERVLIVRLSAFRDCLGGECNVHDGRSLAAELGR